jgi:c-di-GMP-binding flagellar brake protein YcgR
MSMDYVDRRKTARVTMPAGLRFERPVVMSVRLLEISMSGVLMAATQPLEVGQVAQLSARIGAQAIETSIEVRRVAAGDVGKGAYRIGARFVSLDPSTAAMLRQFLSDGDR